MTSVFPGALEPKVVCNTRTLPRRKKVLRRKTMLRQAGLCERLTKDLYPSFYSSESKWCGVRGGNEVVGSAKEGIGTKTSRDTHHRNNKVTRDQT